jgi:anti-anti-sigma factor
MARGNLLCADQEIHVTSLPSSEDLDQAPSTLEVLDGRPLLDVRVVDGLSFVEFVNVQYLVDQDVIRPLSLQLQRLVEGGYTRMLLNFRGVQCISCGVLGMLAALHGPLERAQARMGLCGLDPLMRHMIRICHLEPVFDIYTDQEEALGAAVERGPAEVLAAQRDAVLSGGYPELVGEQ